ncbi:MAG: TetR/AcrR family transcriptional regulator [Mycobacterium sp.]
MQPPSTESVWLRPAKAMRGQPTLTRDQIISAAMQIMDSEGISGLTMRKLAARLRTAPMTLYGHVSTKDDLLEFAVDGVFAEALLDGGPRTWRPRLTAIARRLFDTFLDHPWAPTLLGSKPPMGPAAVAHFGSMLNTLSQAGFEGESLTSAVTAFYYYVLGAATAEAAWVQAGRPFAEVTPGDLERLKSADGGDNAPMVELYRHQTASQPHDRFEMGLRHVLDGLRP